MANKYLLPVFDEIYGEGFRYSDFNQRMEMQKAIYLLQNMGVPVGEYGFRWYLHGPYSQSLQDDMYYENEKKYKKIILSKEYAESVKKLRELVDSEKKGRYSVANWVECLASIHYLKHNVLSFSASDKDVVEELEKRKSHLNDHAANMNACQLVEESFA